MKLLIINLECNECSNGTNKNLIGWLPLEEIRLDPDQGSIQQRQRVLPVYQAA
jgi:hypothetical protein